MVEMPILLVPIFRFQPLAPPEQSRHLLPVQSHDRHVRFARPIQETRTAMSIGLQKQMTVRQGLIELEELSARNEFDLIPAKNRREWNGRSAGKGPTLPPATTLLH